MPTHPLNILHIDSSPRREGSVTRDLTAKLVARFGADADVTYRDLLGDAPELLGTDWVNGMVTGVDDRNEAQRAALAQSDVLLAEIRAADAIVIGAPLYNFAPTASLKAWIDQITRAGESFHYTESGPEGLLADKPVYIVLTSGGTPMDSPADFVTPYLRHMLGFLGLRDLRFIDAMAWQLDADGVLNRANQGIADLALDDLAA